MNKLAWSGLALGIVGVAAAGIGGTACTVTSGTGDDGGITYPSPDSSTDTGTTGNDSGTGEDTGTSDTGSTQDAGGDGGLACATTGDPTCDTCIESNCAMAFCGCSGDTNMVTDDAGSTPACLAYVNCVGSLSKGDPDAGVPPESVTQAETDCSGGDAGGTYPQSSVQTGNSLVACVAPGGPCATACGNQ